MKIIFYNIAYCTGMKGSWRQYLSTAWRYLWTPLGTLPLIAELLNKESPDVVCLAEVDSGSLRNRFQCQAKSLASRLLFPFFSTESKYRSGSIWKWMALIRKQHDAVLSKKVGEVRRHELDAGMKKLVQEFIVDGYSIFTVHLAVLSQKVRKLQLDQLADIVEKCPRPYLVCGDFNLHKRGLNELTSFFDRTKMKLVETPMTFPSIRPRQTIDLFLTSPGVVIKNSGILSVDYSDHLPVWVEVAI